MLTPKNIEISNYFFIKRNRLNENLIIHFKYKYGNIWQYDHDLVYRTLQNKYDTMPCFIKHKFYVNTQTVPKYVQVLDCVKLIKK
jgi:hypothetical protein